METKKFKTGEEVLLISGGPRMTIIGYEPESGVYVTCQWFDKNTLQEKSFHQDTLKVYQRPRISSTL